MGIPRTTINAWRRRPNRRRPRAHEPSALTFERVNGLVADAFRKMTPDDAEEMLAKSSFSACFECWTPYGEPIVGVPLCESCKRRLLRELKPHKSK